MIGEALRLIRIFHDKKQNELAGELNISLSYLSEIERGKKKPSMEIIEKYAQVFHTKASVIIFFASNAPRSSAIFLYFSRSSLRASSGTFSTIFLTFGDIVTPEYEDCKRIAKQFNIPLVDIMKKIT